MELVVGSTTYNVEFTFEAAESDVVNKVFEFFSGAYMAKASVDDSEISEVQSKINMIDASLEMMADSSKLAIDFLYMGLLEHHGPCGDITTDIKTRVDAKNLYKEFCKEQPDSELALHVGLFEALKKQMEDDDFLKRIGLESMLKAVEIEADKVAPEPKKVKTTKKSNA